LDTSQVNAADSYVKEPNAVTVYHPGIPDTETSLTQETPSLWIPLVPYIHWHEMYEGWYAAVS